MKDNIYREVRANKRYHTSLKGADWTIHCLTDAEFDAVHNDDCHGITCPDSKVIDVRQRLLCKELLLHELGHAIRFETHTTTCDMHGDDVEEQMCCIYSENWSMLDTLTNNILKHFNA